MIFKLFLNLALFCFSFLYFGFFAESCTSFYCINSCGKSNRHRGFKLILANNRDEDITRPTIDAKTWPPKINNEKFTSFDLPYCDQSKLKEPFNLCVYGALDEANGVAPNYYSTWLGVNERGSVGNLLFFMGKSSRPSSLAPITPRGVMVGDYIQNSSWPNAESYMEYLTEHKMDFKPFNFVQLEMSRKTGAYNMYYINNNDTKPYSKLNPDDKNSFIFGVSNSDPDRPFQKVINGKLQFENIINDFAKESDKQKLVDSMINDLMMSKKPNYPDKNLASFMGLEDEKYEEIVKGVSQINANYSTYWVNGHTRTCTLILVDYDDNLFYYEYNLTNIDSKLWKMNSFETQLKPLYKNSSLSTNFDFSLIFIIFLIFLNKFY